MTKLRRSKQSFPVFSGPPVLSAITNQTKFGHGVGKETSVS